MTSLLCNQPDAEGKSWAHARECSRSCLRICKLSRFNLHFSFFKDSIRSHECSSPLADILSSLKCWNRLTGLKESPLVKFTSTY